MALAHILFPREWDDGSNIYDSELDRMIQRAWIVQRAIG